MTTNREWLYSLTPGELAAWFDAEHEPDYVVETFGAYQKLRIGKLLEQRDALRELASDMAARMIAVEGICEMGILDARFERRMHELGIEVER